MEKENVAIRNVLKDTTHGSISGRITPPEAAVALDGTVARLKGLRRKLVALGDEEARLHAQVDGRVTHLGELASMHSLDDVRYETWSRRRLDRLLVDYMLRHGYTASAAALADDRSMGDLVDVDTFVAMGKIRDSLRSGSIAEALAWCSENKKELRKMDVRFQPPPFSLLSRFPVAPALG